MVEERDGFLSPHLHSQVSLQVSLLSNTAVVLGNILAPSLYVFCVTILVVVCRAGCCGASSTPLRWWLTLHSEVGMMLVSDGCATMHRREFLAFASSSDMINRLVVLTDAGFWATVEGAAFLALKSTMPSMTRSPERELK